MQQGCKHFLPDAFLEFGCNPSEKTSVRHNKHLKSSHLSLWTFLEPIWQLDCMKNLRKKSQLPTVEGWDLRSCHLNMTQVYNYNKKLITGRENYNMTWEHNKCYFMFFNLKCWFWCYVHTDPLTGSPWYHRGLNFSSLFKLKKAFWVTSYILLPTIPWDSG